MSLQTDLPIMPLTDFTPTFRVKAVESLAKFRQEWEEISEGESLLEVTVPVGLFLADITDQLELTPQERHVILGKLLISEIKGFLSQRVSLRDQ